MKIDKWVVREHQEGVHGQAPFTFFDQCRMAREPVPLQSRGGIVALWSAAAHSKRLLDSPTRMAQYSHVSGQSTFRSQNLL